MLQRFNGCEPDYIRDVCHAACCRQSKGGISVAVTPLEVYALARRGATITDGLIEADSRDMCPFQMSGTFLCDLHGSPTKPFGCQVSPFILTSRDTLVVRNRYRLLKCYDDGRRLPAHEAFRGSLVALMGPKSTQVIVDRITAGERANFEVRMPDISYRMLKHLEGVR